MKIWHHMNTQNLRSLQDYSACSKAERVFAHTYH